MDTFSTIQSTIKEIRDKHTDLADSACEELAEIEKRARDLKNKRVLLENPLFKERIQKLRKKVEEFNQRLLTEKDMTDEERTKVFTRRDIYEEEIAEFSTEEIDQKLKAIQGEVSGYLDKLNKGPDENQNP